MGPWYHVTAGDGLDMGRLHLQWFDHWLKGIDTGIDADAARRCTSTSSATASTSRRARYPFAEPPRRRTTSAPATRSARRKPKDASGADQIVFTGATSPCDRQSDQWGAGGARARHERPEPVRRQRQLAAGRARRAHLHDRAVHVRQGDRRARSTPRSTRRSTRPDTYFEATIEDIDPSGTSTSLTAGGLLGSFRALDAEPDLARARRQPAAALPPLHARVGNAGADRQGHALRHRGVPDVRARSPRATACA